MAIEISLAANGNINLHLPMHVAQVPMSVEGVALLRHVLQANTKGARKVGEDGNPTQWQLDAWLKSPQGQGALQLAGERKRFAQIKAATDVQVRRTRSVPINIEGMDLDDLL
jgi:hypothetical protein